MHVKIALFTDAFFPFTCGVSSAIFQQANALASRGHQCFIVCPAAAERSLSGLHPNVRVIDAGPTIPIRRFMGLRAVLPSVVPRYRWVKRLRPDVIHCHSEMALAWEGLICGKFFGIPVIGHYHTMFAHPLYLQAAGLPSGAWAQKVVWSYSTSFYNRCDHVLAPSRAAASLLTMHGVRRTVSVISNGTPPPLDDEAPPWRMPSLEGLGPGPHLVHAGRISHEKSILTMLESFHGIASRAPNTNMVLIGDGAAMSDVTQYLQQNQLEGRVVRLGMVERRVLLRERLYGLGSIFVTASETETQGLCVLEAMSMGLPVVAVAKGGIPELVTHGRNGLLAPQSTPEDLAPLLLQLLNDHELRGRLGSAACLDVHQHRMPQVAAELEELYRKLIANGHATVAPADIDRRG